MKLWAATKCVANEWQYYVLNTKDRQSATYLLFNCSVGISVNGKCVIWADYPHTEVPIILYITRKTNLTPKLVFLSVKSSPFRNCVSIIYFFKWRDPFYEWTERAAMESPFFPVLAKLFMENFERILLDFHVPNEVYSGSLLTAPSTSFLHEEEYLHSFLDYLNMQPKLFHQIPYFSWTFYLQKKENSSLTHTVYRKPSHDDCCV